MQLFQSRSWSSLLDLFIFHHGAEVVFHICTNNVYISKMEHRLSLEVKDQKVKETQRLDLLPKQCNKTLDILVANVNTLFQSQRPRPFAHEHFH